MSEIVIVNTRPEHIDQLVQHQRICFPTLADHELMRREHFESQLRIFPEGQHVALDGERVVGQSSTFRISGAVAFAPPTPTTGSSPEISSSTTIRRANGSMAQI
jgi:hypothetical protein